MRRLAHVLILAACWFGLWLLLVEKFTPAELLVGTACALVAAAASEVAWGDHLTSFSGDPRLLGQAWRLPWMMIRDTAIALEVLARHLFTRRKAKSLLRVVPFRAGAEGDPHATARRALAIAYSTMTANCVVIGIDTEKELMLYHQLEKTPAPELLRRLGAQP